MDKQIRDCENCIHHKDGGCEVWECKFEEKGEARCSTKDLRKIGKCVAGKSI